MSTNYDLILSPNGHPRWQNGTDAPPEDPWAKRVASAFSVGHSAGLFTLAASDPHAEQPPSLHFWREFARAYMTELCRTPPTGKGQPASINPPTEAELATTVLSAPPMQGGEYLTTDVLRDLWSYLDEWVRNSVAESDTGFDAWLGKKAKSWHQVGRVCFHLAENKNNPDRPFAFLATYAPKLSTAGKVQFQPLGKALREYAGAKDKKALTRLLEPVQRAAESVDFVKELVDSGDIFHPLGWTPREAHRLLRETEALEESGLRVRLPDWWRKRSRPRVSVTIGGKGQALFGAGQMMDFQVGLALGEESLTEAEWTEIMRGDDGLAFVRGQWIEVDKEKLGEALDHWKQVEAEAAEGGISFIEGMRLLAGVPADLSDDAEDDNEREWVGVGAGAWLSEILSNLRDPTAMAGWENSPDFQGTLRPYQEIGRDWLRLLSGLGLGACLADDMGLGKTVQVLSFLLTAKHNGEASGKKPALLVLPASLLANWKAEIARFAPTLETGFVHASESDTGTPAEMSEKLTSGSFQPDVVLTTYGMLLRQEWLLDLEWDTVILDEAQAIKNPASRQTKAVKQLKAKSRIALTGTPVENRLGDLWSLFDFLCPGLLGSANRFRTFVKSLEAREQDRYAPLRNLVSPYILRRLKTDKTIISDLPDKTEMKAFCGLAKKQALLYARSVKSLEAALEKGEGGMKRRGLVLSYLMRFKQICNHPNQFLGDGEYSAKDSGKFAKLTTLCEEIASRQEKVLVFTQFREMTDPLAETLATIFGREGLVLHGGTAVKRRQSLVDAFQKEDGPPFFILSLKAGGTGLNLTAASHVIHFDRWWNPAVENQATDRAFRIGQRRNVVVHKFVCRGTLEEKIDKMLEEKSNLADDLLKQGGDAMLTEMSDAELLDAVTLNVDHATI